MLRLAWNKQDPNYIAALFADSNKAVILDVRLPSMAVVELCGHQAALNGIAWAPHSASHVCTCGYGLFFLILSYVSTSPGTLQG